MGDIINELIVETTQNIGATGLSITHDMSSARKIADRIAMLYKGKIIWHGTVEEIEKTKNEFLRQFINGNSEGPIDFEPAII